MTNPLRQAQSYETRYDLIAQIATQLNEQKQQPVGNANCQGIAANTVHAMDAHLDNAFIAQMGNMGLKVI